MEITISLTQLLLGMLIIAGIVFVIYLIVLIGKLIPAMKHLTKVLENAEKLTDEAVVGVESAKETITKVGASVRNVAEVMDGNQGMIKNATSLVKAGASLVGMFKDSGKDDADTKSTKGKSGK